MLTWLWQNTSKLEPHTIIISLIVVHLLMLLTLVQVAFNTCSVLTDDTAEAYGLVWKPAQAADLPSAVQLPVTSAAPTRPGCFWYKVGATAGTRHQGRTRGAEHSYRNNKQPVTALWWQMLSLWLWLYYC
jgi:hypothetical protein